jgi:hypothetical protein
MKGTKSEICSDVFDKLPAVKCGAVQRPGILMPALDQKTVTVSCYLRREPCLVQIAGALDFLQTAFIEPDELDKPGCPTGAGEKLAALHLRVDRRPSFLGWVASHAPCPAIKVFHGLIERAEHLLNPGCQVALP